MRISISSLSSTRINGAQRPQPYCETSPEGNPRTAQNGQAHHVSKCPAQQSMNFIGLLTAALLAASATCTEGTCAAERNGREHCPAVANS
jgi:hypothetical protein